MTAAFGQKERKNIRKGNKEYEAAAFEESEVFYRKALEINPAAGKATFNLGNALYRQEKFEDAAGAYQEQAQLAEEADRRSRSWFNLGNTLLEGQKYQESIEAYKNALRENPGDTEAKYNLAYAQDMLQQQQQQQQQQDQNKDQQQQNDQNKQESDNQDQNKDQPSEDQQQNQPQESQNKEGEQDQQKPSEQEISKEDAQRLLEALANMEKKVQEKVQKARAKQQKTRSVKEW